MSLIEFLIKNDAKFAQHAKERVEDTSMQDAMEALNELFPPAEDEVADA